LTEILTYLGFTNVTDTTVETFPTGTYNITLYAEFAGYYDTNELSYYEVGTDVFTVVFTGPEGNQGYVSPPITNTFTAPYSFGLSMLSVDYRYFTETSRNPDGLQHAIVYRNLDDPYMFLVGFENLYGNACDRDFNDMVLALRYEAAPLSASIEPATARIKVGEFVTFTSTVSGGAPDYAYQWYLNGSAVPEATGTTWTFAPDLDSMAGFYTVYLEVTDSFGVTAQSNEAGVTVRPRLLVSIAPLSASIVVGESVGFTATVSGGYPPYSYQWYVDGSPVSGATASTWSFTPTAGGTYLVHVVVTDDNANVVQSDAATVTAIIPVGGYSVSLGEGLAGLALFGYVLVVALLGMSLGLVRRKKQ
jgi:hypothetical protein